MSSSILSIDDKIDCLEREIKLRKSLYPRLVNQGKITQEHADREILTMQAIVQDYRQSAKNDYSNLPLFT